MKQNKCGNMILWNMYEYIMNINELNGLGFSKLKYPRLERDAQTILSRFSGLALDLRHLAGYSAQALVCGGAESTRQSSPA